MNETSFDIADDVVAKATMFAVAAHSGQTRKDGKTPAVVHAMEAAVIAATMTHDLDVMAAALLHDTVEDTDVTSEQIYKMFGKRIGDLVASETENKYRGQSPEDTWLLRKQESIEELKQTSELAVKIIWLSDKLSNMRSFYRSFRVEGSAFWQRFHQKDPKMHEWYYRSVADAVSELSDTAAYEEYILLMNKIFG